MIVQVGKRRGIFSYAGLRCYKAARIFIVKAQEGYSVRHFAAHRELNKISRGPEERNGARVHLEIERAFVGAVGKLQRSRAHLNHRIVIVGHRRVANATGKFAARLKKGMRRNAGLSYDFHAPARRDAIVVGHAPSAERASKHHRPSPKVGVKP